MAEKRVQLTLDEDVHLRLIGAAANEGCTIQNVVVSACRAWIGESQRGRVGHGRRLETTVGGVLATAAGPTTLDLKIGVNTCTGVEARAVREGIPFEVGITRALRQWLGMSPDSVAERFHVRGAQGPKVPREEAAEPAGGGQPRPPLVASQAGPAPTLDAPAVHDVTGLVAFARTALAPILEHSGNILYSGVETLRPGSVYLLGLNPGGDPGDAILQKQTIGATLDALPTLRQNEWLDVSWRRAGVRTPPGMALLQQRVRGLLEGLGLPPREVCASNLIFARSRDANSSDFARLAPICWPVHRAIISMVRPRLILVFGNSGVSPYGHLFDVFKPAGEMVFPSGHGDWQCRAFDAGEFHVAGLPHLSRYAIDRHPEVVAWLRQLLADRIRDAAD